MKDTHENADALISFFYEICEFYGLVAQKVMAPLDKGKVNFALKKLKAGTNGQCRTEKGVAHFALTSLGIDFLLDEETDLAKAKACITHEVTHAWCHEVDPLFYDKAVDLLYDPTVKSRLYWSPGNIIEEPARLASKGYDVRQIYLHLINYPSVRQSVEAGNLAFIKEVGMELSSFRELFYKPAYTNKVSLPLDLFRQIL